MRYLPLFLLVISPIFSEIESPQLQNLVTEFENQGPEAVDQFWSGVVTPLIEPASEKDKSLVTFLWKGDDETENVKVVDGLSSLFVDEGSMEQIPNTNVWHKTFLADNDVRTTYLISVNDDVLPMGDLTIDEFLVKFSDCQNQWQQDPLNPTAFTYGGEKWKFTKSVLELPNAEEKAWSLPIDGVKSGEVKHHKFESATLENSRNVWVYTPYGYDKKHKGYPFVVLFDGECYLNLMPTTTILDNLISKGKIPPCVVVFVSNASQEQREVELPCHQPFSYFVGHELVPWVRLNYKVTSHPSKAVVAGSSYGGLAASYTALKNPTIFGKVLSQSGSYWWKPESDEKPEWLTKQFSKCAKLPMQFYLDVGSLERKGSFKDSINIGEANDNFHKILKDKGYMVKFQEYSGGHDYICWEKTLSDGLVYLLGSLQK